MADRRPALLAWARGCLAAGLLVLGGVAAAEDEQVEYGVVGYAHITGIIDRMRARYLERAIADAREQGIDTLVVHIDTDGGHVRYAREMFKQVVDTIHDGPRMIAFVDDRAISAGAMIAYAHEAIWMAETASIGDIGVIFRNREGEIEYAPEKIETVIRTLLVQAAEQRGWSRGLLLKMTAHKQKLFRVTLADDTQHFVIEDDLPEFLAHHPAVDEDDEDRVFVYRGEDRLLTLTGREAVRLGMATGVARDLDALYVELGVEPVSAVDLSPRPAEMTAWFLASVAPMLAGLAMLFLIFELKTPGVGVFALIAATSAVAFVFAQYYLDMVENIELVLIALGTVLVVAEVLTMAGGGMLAVLGAVLAFAGLVLAFLPNEFEYDFSDEVFLDALSDAVLSSLIATGVVVLGMLAFIHFMPRSSLGRRLAVEAAVTATSAGTLEARGESLAGRRGVAREALHPGGIVAVDGADHGARAEHGVYIEAGAPIEVVAVEFGELVVCALAKPVADGEASDAG